MKPIRFPFRYLDSQLLSRTFSFCLFLSFIILACAKPLDASTIKEDVLRKYEEIIVTSHQMNIYGYELGTVTAKLKHATDLMAKNELGKASSLLDTIKKDLEHIKVLGPEHIRREQRLVWLEILGDFLQQLALVVILSIILLRFRSVFNALKAPAPNVLVLLQLVLIFFGASFISAVAAWARYGESSWLFIDLQVIFAAIAGIVGGVWVGLITGIINGGTRFLMSPETAIYAAVPVVVGVLPGLIRSALKGRALRRVELLACAIFASAVHAVIMYAPLLPYIAARQFFDSVLLLSITETLFILLFFVCAQQIQKERTRRSTEEQLMRTELKFLQAQINPHFLFNTLNTIASVCGDEGATKARSLVMKLSTLFRRIARTQDEKVTMREELEYLEAYLDIVKARFGDRTEVLKDISLSDASMDTKIPTLIIQPIIENAIQHGLSKRRSDGKLKLSASETEEQVVISVEDNGMGMAPGTIRKLLSQNEAESRSRNKDTGIGITNVRDRLRHTYGNKSKLEIESIISQGTIVRIHFPRVI